MIGTLEEYLDESLSFLRGNLGFKKIFINVKRKKCI